MDEYTNEYMKEMIEKYKDAKDWYEIVCDMIFRVRNPHEKEEDQSIPSRSTYNKFLFIQEHGTDIQKKWCETGYKSMFSVYNAIKKRKIKIPEDKIAIKPNENYRIMFISEGDPIPIEGEILPDVELYDFDGKRIKDNQIVFLSKNKKMPHHAMKIPKNTELAISEEQIESSDKFVLKYEDWLKKTTTWIFPNFDNRFGGDEISRDYPSRIPGQILMNLLYYYTQPGDLVIDPFAGSGTNYNVIKMAETEPDMKLIRGRRILCYDINLVRPYIRKHDITRGYPDIKMHFEEDYPNVEYRGVKLIFFDPPYWSMKKYKEKKGFEEGTLEQFYEHIEKLAKDSYNILDQEGKISFIIMDQTEKDTGKPIHHSINCYNIFKKVGFTPIEEISVPRMGMRPTAASPDYLSSKRLLGTYRILFIMQKGQ